jgi:O-acetyl-ADP-ribose deacetylase (regulator of RNase III)
MNIVLTAVDEPLARAWEEFCGDVEGVTTYRGSILDVACDAVVSPANSFGSMDGGIDAVYMDYFSSNIERSVRRAIVERHHGELLVGTADIVETGDPGISYLIAAPTMRVPMVLHESVNAYLAARAVLLLVLKGRFPDGRRQGQPITDVVQTVAFPGLGTGVGRMKPRICARQVRRALDDILLEEYTLPPTWEAALRRHHLLLADRPRYE